VEKVGFALLASHISHQQQMSQSGKARFFNRLLRTDRNGSQLLGDIRMVFQEIKNYEQ
jgi:hypothetical protein